MQRPCFLFTFLTTYASSSTDLRRPYNFNSPTEPLEEEDFTEVETIAYNGGVGMTVYFGKVDY